MHLLEKALETAAGSGAPIIIDGATGTELQKRGVPMDGVLWNALATETHPEILAQIHRDYLEIGAQIILANTFSSSRYMLDYGGQAHRFENLNRKAVQVALAAREQSGCQAWVAGVISTTTLFQEWPEVALARRDFQDQAALYAEAGADLIMLEMMKDVDLTAAAVEAAVATGLPTWIGYSVARGDEGQVMSISQRMTFRDMLEALDTALPQAVGIMHSETEDVGPALEILKEYWTGAVFVYAHSGEFRMPNWQFSDIIAPADYATLAATWVREGVVAVGSCCGLGPDHIRHLVQTWT